MRALCSTLRLLFSVFLLSFFIQVAAVHVVNDYAREVFDLDSPDCLRTQLWISNDFGFRDAFGDESSSSTYGREIDSLEFF